MKNHPVQFDSIAQLHKAIGLPAPANPLISIIDYGDAMIDPSDFEKGVILDFYKVSFNTFFNGRLRYGQGHYNFKAGGMSFLSPGQVLRMEVREADYAGITLHLHPEFLRGYQLNAFIKQYVFFSYSSSEALYLSEKEKRTILAIFDFIKDELSQRIDKFSQDVIISQIELLLNYANRSYHRQFATSNTVSKNVLGRLEKILDNYFNGENSLIKGLPSVRELAGELNITPRYLSDLLRNIIGMNTQQYIHERVIEKAKEYLGKDELSIAEVAYHLGFEHPQSFTKLFKAKTSISPLDYKKKLFK